MLLFVLGVIDITGGIVLSIVSAGFIGPSDFLFYLGVFFILKGIWSFLTSVAGGFYFDLLGIVDIIAAIGIFLVNMDILSGLFFWVGVILVLKGIYSAVIGIPVS